MKKLWMSVIAMTGILLAPKPEAAFGDYLFSQEYDTVQKGEFETDLYNNFNMPKSNKDNTYNSEHEVELEYGLTDHLQLAAYEVFTWDNSENWQQDSLKAETKYRFLESGKLPVDITLYGEYKNPNGSRDAHSDELEGRLILSRDFGPWNVTGNLVAERKINEHEDLQWEYDAGVSCAVKPQVRLGLEIRETLRDSREFQLMPMIAANLTPHVRVLFGPAFGLTRAADDIQLNSITEIEF